MVSVCAWVHFGNLQQKNLRLCCFAEGAWWPEEAVCIENDDKEQQKEELGKLRAKWRLGCCALAAQVSGQLS